MLGLLKSWTPELPAELDAAGPKLLLTSGLPAVPGLLTLLGRLLVLVIGVLARLLYFLVIFTKMGGVAVTFCCVMIKAVARACFHTVLSNVK